MGDTRRYTLKDLQDANRLGIQEGIQRAQNVVMEMSKQLINNMTLCIKLDKPDSAERYREMHDTIALVYQDLCELEMKVK